MSLGISEARTQGSRARFAGSRNEKIALAGAVISFLLFAVFLKLGNLSTGGAVNIQNDIIKKMIVETSGLSTTAALSSLLLPFAALLIALVFLVLALAFLSSYGFFRDGPRIALTASALGALMLLVFAGLSIVTLALSAAMILGSFYVMKISAAYSSEIKKWPRFRTGSNSIGKALLVINLLIAIGIFAAVLSAQAQYAASFKADLKDSINTIVAASLPSNLPIDAAQEKQIDALIDKQINASPLFSAYIRWLPVTSAFSVWVILEFLRIFLPSIGGAFTSAIIPAMGKK